MPLPMEKYWGSFRNDMGMLSHACCGRVVHVEVQCHANCSISAPCWVGVVIRDAQRPPADEQARQQEVHGGQQQLQQRPAAVLHRKVVQQLRGRNRSELMSAAMGCHKSKLDASAYPAPVQMQLQDALHLLWITAAGTVCAGVAIGQSMEVIASYWYGLSSHAQHVDEAALHTPALCQHVQCTERTTHPHCMCSMSAARQQGWPVGCRACWRASLACGQAVHRAADAPTCRFCCLK